MSTIDSESSESTYTMYSTSASTKEQEVDDQIQTIQNSIYNAILQNHVEGLTELLNNNNFDINQPLKGSRRKTGNDVKKEKVASDENGDGEDKNALMIACSLDCVDIIKYLLSRSDTNIDLQDKGGETALYQASALGNLEAVKLLLKHNANLDIYNSDQETPLIIASYHGHTAVVKVLLDKCKNVDYQDNLCKTALSFAALEGHPQIVELLLKKGANVNLADKFGWTPLMSAAYSGRANICRQLLTAKADKTLKSNDDKTASMLARDGNFYHVSEMIDRFVFNPSTTNHDEEHGRKSESRYSRFSRHSRHSRYSRHYGNIDSRRISTASRLREEMLPRKGNTWWVYVSWVTTVFFLDRFLIKYGKMQDERVRQAWREKFTLCFIVFVSSVIVAMLTFGFVSIACSPSLQPPVPLSLVNDYWGGNSSDKVMIIRGKLYNVGNYFESGGHRPIMPFNDKMLEPIINQYYGKDIGELFPVDDNAIGCNKKSANKALCEGGDARYHCHTSRNSLKTLESLSINRYVSIPWDEISNTPSRKLFAFRGKIYDLTTYLSASNTDKWLGNDTTTTTWLESLIGKEATAEILNVKNNDLKEVIKCFPHFQIGETEGLQYGCATTTVTVVTITTMATIFGIIKLLSGLIFDNVLSKQLAQTVDGEETKKDVIIMVPCYSEGYDSMKASFDSLSATHYPDENKLFLIIADGNITGSGNDKSTPDILLDLIVPSSGNFNNVKAKSYLAIGDGTKRHNMAKVYSGYYQYQERRIPAILIIKVGNPEESKYPRAGNRGKRDSQLVLMQLLQHAFNNGKMSPLEFDIFEKVRKLTQKTIDQYEFVVMVDADTIVEEDSIGQMINCMNNPEVIGLCGETKILNKTESWVTMIQVFEYYLSHHFGKTFESVYACVTCLPGCFCMYRIYSYNSEGLRIPILIDETIMSNYSTNEVDTLHQKNLLLLGEDRYLTTLILRAFPKRKTLYCPSAVCKTIVPTEFSVLLSQRRRWINGTIHNMFELIVTPELPGRFCFSMQFAVFLDLFGTFTSPFALTYILFTLIRLIAGQAVQFQVMLIAITFGLQLFLAIFTAYNPIIILWFLIFLISVPIWYILLPLYSFWNFDDFSWGATRKLDGDEKSGYSDTIFDRFNPKSVPLKRWDQWIKGPNNSSSRTTNRTNRRLSFY